ncbi:MAG TPA: 3-methyl-2-oxobutanoate hydroxymethyltransferase [Clostridiales bacterium]|nr:3-methyl-2-oxobutanoate hydroxymethyltransferase [Clostridiales bacterium]
MAKITTLKLQEMKDKGEKITMVTAYDYSTACLVEKAGIDVILIGDSLMMTMLGDDSTVACTMDQMIHHTKPVVLGAPNTHIVTDMPFGSYNVSKEEAIKNATRMLKEGRCDAVKLEGGREIAETIKAIVDAGIPVMGHIGLTPQTVSMLGGFKVQGKGDAAKDVLEDALAVEAAGAYSIVLECIPEQLGKLITEKLRIPTIGIGGGRFTDGQVMVYHDMVGLFEKFIPKFVKQYINLGPEIIKALETYKEEVKSGAFPGEEHTFGGVLEEELKRLY